MGWRAADGVRRPGGSPPGAGGVAGTLLRAQVRSLWPAQVDDVRRPLAARCRPAPGTHGPSCAQLGPRCGAFDLPPAPTAAAVGSRAQGERGVSLYHPPRHDALCTCARCMVCRSWVGKSVSRRGSAGGRMGQGARPSRSVSRAMRRTCCVWLLLVSARHFPHSILILYSRGSLSAEICWFGSQHARHACDLGRATDCDDQGVQHGPHALRTAFHSCGLG